jgi:heat shock protein beta
MIIKLINIIIFFSLDAIQNLGDFEGHKLQSLTKEGVKFNDEDEDVVKKRIKAYRAEFKPLTKYLKELFKGKVGKVTVSQRVESSPSIITTSQYGHTANMERIMKSQTFSNPEAYKHMLATKTLELNPRHPIVIELQKLVAEKPKEESTKDLAFLLYDTALLQSGFQHEEVESFSSRIYRTLANGLNLKSLALVDELQVEEEDEEEEDKEPSSEDSFETPSHDEF